MTASGPLSPTAPLSSAIDSVEVFRKLSEESRGLLARGMQVYRFPKGETVVHRGQSVSGAYFVVSGGLRVHTVTPSGKDAPLYHIAPGETCVVAINSLFNGLSYPAWVTSEAETMVAVVPGSLYRALFAREVAIQDVTVRALSTLVFRLMDELEGRQSATVAQRLTRYLLTHGKADGRVQSTQGDLAARIGTTREVVARILADFSKRGLVETGRGWVAPRDIPGLEEILGDQG